MLQPTNKEVSYEYTKYHDEKNAYRWTEPSRATGRPKSTPNSQLKREPSNTEEGNRTKSPKAPSVSQASPGTVRGLEIAIIVTRIQKLSRDIGAPVLNITIIAMRTQELSRDIGVPVPISRRMYDMDQNVYKIERNKPEKLNGAVEYSQNTSRSVQVEVSVTTLTVTTPTTRLASPPRANHRASDTVD